MSEKEFLAQVQANQGIIYKLVGLYVTDKEEKKDLYQEVLLQTWKAWPSFRGEAKFSTWLYRITLNTILTWQRKEKKMELRDDLENLSPAVPHKSLQQEEAQRLHWAIRRLAETDRAIISLSLEGFDNGEIADMLGISANHVAVKLHRIKQQLQNVLNTGK
ncbi:MAG TPA: sigma-70 family RNA polymerase sigma factor [Chitinophagaceae bacterium]|nr:sigma-70 family RNA polymerase sigma factor [Chitinophagaceae bacterium]